MNHIGLFEGINSATRFCRHCGKEFKAVTGWQKYCHRNCLAKANTRIKGLVTEKGRHCKMCGLHFLPKTPGNLHCSDDCRVQSAKQSRSKFFKNNPGVEKKYYKKTIGIHGHKGNLDRYYLRYPDAPKSCESCGESRVLDIAHKPEHKRNGQWRSVANTSPEKVWILCPTCHALIDRKGYEPTTLGLT